MAMRLMGQDCAAQVTDGGAFSPTGPTYTTAIPVKAFAKSIKASDKVTTESLRGLGDTREKKRPKFAETSVTIELMIESTGPVVLTLGGYVKFEYKHLNTDAAYKVLEGILTGNDVDLPDGPQMQTLTIECDADNV